MTDVVRWIRETAAGIVWVNRRPARLRSAWVNTILWGFALAVAISASTLDLFQQEWPWLLWNLAVGGLDAYMLRHAVVGLRWHLKRKPRRRAEASWEEITRRAGGPQGE